MFEEWPILASSPKADASSEDDGGWHQEGRRLEAGARCTLDARPVLVLDGERGTLDARPEARGTLDARPHQLTDGTTQFYNCGMSKSALKKRGQREAAVRTIEVAKQANSTCCELRRLLTIARAENVELMALVQSMQSEQAQHSTLFADTLNRVEAVLPQLVNRTLASHGLNDEQLSRRGTVE